MSDNENYSRPRRRKVNEKQTLLDNIKNSRNSGYNFKQNIVIEDVYDIVDDKYYDELVEKRQQDIFVEDEFDDGREIFDESSEDERKVQNSLKRKKSTKHPDAKKSKLSHYGGFNMTGKTSMNTMSKQNLKSKNKCVSDDMADLLAEIESPNPSQAVEHRNPYQNKNSIKKFDINKPRFDTNNKTMDKKLLQESKCNKIEFSKVHVPEKQAAVTNLTKHVSKTEFVDKEQLKKSENTENCVKPVDDNHHSSDQEFMDIDFDEPFDEVEKGFTIKNDVKKVESVWLDAQVESEELNQEIFTPQEKTAGKQIYWFDAYYDKKIQGVIFLFGKMYDSVEKAYINCCVRVSGLERRLYFLPKDGCDLKDVHEELSSLFTKYNIDSFRSKPVTRKYAFQLKDVPEEADYLMVLYDSKYQELPTNLKGETFSHVFGTNTSCLENFILDLKLKGPCWLNFVSLEPVSSQFSTCKKDFQVNGIRGITKLDEKAPRFSVLSLNIKTIVNKKTNMNEIVSVGGLVHSDVSFDQSLPKVYQKHFTIITHPKDNVMPYDVNHKLESQWGDRYKGTVSVEPNERSLINNLLAKLQRLDPDLIVGHSLFGFQLEILLQRCQALNLNHWYRLGRLKRNIVLPKVTSKSSSWLERMATAGRLIGDISVSARELVKVRSYELYDLVQEILPEKYHCLQDHSSVGNLNNLFVNSDSVKQLIDITMNEAICNLYLLDELQILPLALEITSICGNLLSRTLSSGKSERNEYLLLHAFHEKDYIVPDKTHAPIVDNKPQPENDDTAIDGTNANYSKRKPAYAGGLVLDPKKGFYENFILLMDFNSLYPSIIREYNICFTTIDRTKYLESDPENSENNDDLEVLMNLSYQASFKPPGILPNEIRKLVESRTAVKNELLNQNLSNARKMQLNIRQKALKITANSIYGCLGFNHSRFKATHLAALVTCHGRSILTKTKDLVSSGVINIAKKIGPNNIVLDIIYGDTDSIMVNTGISNVAEYDQVMKIGYRIKEEVNKMYKYIKLDIDGVLRRILLLNKKKYAALVVEKKNPDNGQLITKQELKGLDIVRRDWCKLSVEVGKAVVTKILEGNMSLEDLNESIHSYLRQISENIKSGKIDLDKFVITKALTRNPENYSNVQGQPHVQVALRLNKECSEKQYRAKDTVEYVICTDGTTQNAAQRAYSSAEVTNSFKNHSKSLVIDSNYYLAHQLHPVISRLVDQIDGMSQATVAENLGIDSKRFKLDTKEDNNLNDEEELAMSGINKYKDCKPLVITCPKCASKTCLDSQIEPGKLWKCTTCSCDILSSTANAILVSKQLSTTIRKLIRIYYSSIFSCQDIECKYICREIPTVCHVKSSKSLTKTGEFICPRCGHGTMKPIISHSQMHNQLSYYHFLFSYKGQFSRTYDERLKIMTDQLNSVLKISNYGNVNFEQLFSSLFKSKLKLKCA